MSLKDSTAYTADSSSFADETELSRQYDTPLGVLHAPTQALKSRIKQHYDVASDYYLRLCGALRGEHIHHGYWPTKESERTVPKDVAQTNLIQLVASMAQIPPNATVLDVGCGIGGSSRYLASELGCTVTGITISDRQVDIATRLTKTAAAAAVSGGDDDDHHHIEADADGFIKLNKGCVRFIELDGEKMVDYFADQDRFDVVWITEALAHFPDKALFFRNAQSVLKDGGKVAFADWARAESLSDEQLKRDIRPIEDGMLLPPLCSESEYLEHAANAGLKLLEGPKDISANVAKTWDITWGLVQSPSLWAFALSQGRDFIAYLQSFRAMRRGFATGTIKYTVVSWQK